MGWLSRLLRSGPSEQETELALKALKGLRRLVDGAKTLEEMRQRIAEGAKKGDLDDVVGQLAQSDAEVRDFIENG